MDETWALIERFSTMVRERPYDVSAAADVIVVRLKEHGVPVTVLPDSELVIFENSGHSPQIEEHDAWFETV